MPFKSKVDHKHWYQVSGESAKRANRQKIARASKRAMLTEIKDVPCLDCKVRYPNYVMDFDHVRGEKSFNLAKAVDDNVSVEKLLAEVAKCDIVCSNCHRERTHTRLE